METTPAIVQTLPDFSAVLPRLVKGQQIGVDLLKEITKVTKDTKQQVIDAMAENRKVTEKINGLRMPLTKQLDELKQSIMVYEKGSQAEYDRVKVLLDAFNQIELEIQRKAEAKAARELEITKYKSTVKESVGKAVIGMVGGQVRNIIEGMAKWEGGLTLANIDGKSEELGKKQLQLKRDEYDKCFKTEFTGKRIDLITDEDFIAFMESMKAEFSYEKANEDYLQQASPIINEYRAKIPTIKTALASVKTVDAEELRKKAIADKAWEDLQSSQKATDAKVEEVVQTKDKEIMEGEFVRQGTLDGMEAGPTEFVASFEDINMNKWLKPFLDVVGKVALHPKFKLVKPKKAEYIDSVQWFMDFYGKNFTEKILGIKMVEKAKTIVRASKEEF